jgi:hypothetical protein
MSSPSPPRPDLRAFTVDGLREQPSGWRALAPPLAVATAALASLATVALRDPNTAGHYPTCPSISLFGVHCPGCGALRGLHELAHADVAGMIARNALMPIGLVLLAWAWFAWVDRRLGRDRVPALRPPVPVLYGATAVVLAFAVLRNLPMEPFAALAP